MDRRSFFALGSAAAVTSVSFASPLSESFTPTPAPETVRPPVLVRAGHSRLPGGTDTATSDQAIMVRSTDSQGRLAAFVVPVADGHPYTGAPLHFHHEQDEWLYVLAGEFVAEVGGVRYRLKTGDSLLMPMKIPHRWSRAATPHAGILHLYTPAGLMDVWWDTRPDKNASQTLAQRKPEFEQHGTTLLGGPLTKEDIDQTA